MISRKHYQRMFTEQGDVTQGEIGSISKMLKFLMDERLKQDEEMARERCRRDDELAEERQ